MRIQTSAIHQLARSGIAVVTIQLSLLGVRILPVGAQTTWDDVDFWRKWPASLSGASNPQVQGHWAPPTPELLPGAATNVLYGVHASVLYDGEHERLLLFRNRGLVYDLETPDQYWELNLIGTGDPVPTPNRHEPFCSGYVPLADGRLFIVGTSFWKYWSDPESLIPMTDGEVSMFDPSANMTNIDDYWEVADDLPHEAGQPLGGLGPGAPDCTDCAGEPHPWSLARYYPTLVRLEDNRVLVASGDFWIDCQNPPGNPCACGCQGLLEIDQQNKWAIWDRSASPGSQWIWDNNADTGLGGTFTNPWVDRSGSTLNPFMVSYPRMKMLPFGLFYAGNDGALDSTARSSYLWTPLSGWSLPNSPHLENLKKKNRFTGGCVVLTLDATSTDISILLVGGGSDTELSNGTLPKQVEGAEIITYRQDPVTGDVSALSGGWNYAGQMASSMARTDANTVLLPDGKVMAIGGEIGEEPSEQNRDCEIFTPNEANPPGGQWSAAADLGADRGHHSIAVLLPDGRVLSTGHENHHGEEAYFGFDYQIFYPPYLFSSATTFAVRDTIETWPNPEDSDLETPEYVAYGLPFEVTVRDGDADEIDEVAIMAPCSPTHGTDFSQVRVRLSHAAVPGDPGRLVVSAP